MFLLVMNKHVSIKSVNEENIYEQILVVGLTRVHHDVAEADLLDGDDDCIKMLVCLCLSLSVAAHTITVQHKQGGNIDIAIRSPSTPSQHPSYGNLHYAFLFFILKIF